MSDLRRVPPGRAGRLWLMARLHTARLAVDLLDRKLRILRLEQERFRLRASQTDRAWQASWRTADLWGMRAAVLAGRRELRLSAPTASTEVRVTWASVMGVRYPAGASCRLPQASDADRSPGSAALVEAIGAYRTAVADAVAHAAAEAARRTVEAEVAVTRRRRRAIANRLVPRLESALATLNADLEETERAETIRLRWAAGHGERQEGTA